ncbi:putative bifunctional transcriptional activator/DNA repair enzyme AlkA [Halioglobus japonicus]|nr:putative bifunctional transcriptional activator/DNA repair enzyme AlkA [Halioglobus japonicus]
MSEVVHSELLEISKLASNRLLDIIHNNGVILLEPDLNANLFDFLARTVIGQQLSAKAARTIWGRVESLSRPSEQNLSHLFTETFECDVKACGVSRNKYRAISGLRDAMESKQLSTDRLLSSSYEEVKEVITSLWGFGNWSADMTAIFFCGQQDVYPSTDVAIVQGLSKITDQKKSPEELAFLYKPYRSYLCRHIWLATDNGYLE